HVKWSLRSRPTGSLFVQLATLTGLTLILAEAISLFLLFNLPPPTPDFNRLSEIEQTFRGPSPVFTERRPLEVRFQAKPPGPAMDGASAPAIRARLAADLHMPQDRVVLATRAGPFADRRVFRIIRDRIAREGVREEHFLVAPFDVGVRQPDGRWAVIRPQPAFGLSAWQARIALWFVLSALVMAPVAYVFARRLSRPISLFADAAERLRRYVEDRTAMVGAIAHDLRTPLTRLRFRIEGLPEEQRAKMGADIDQMEEMISAALTFVRDASRPGERTPLELSSLLESLCDEMAETGAATEVE